MLLSHQGIPSEYLNSGIGQIHKGETKLKLFDLTGKRAIVTGAGCGLGRSMAIGLAQAGASVVALDKAANIKEIAVEMSQGTLLIQGVQADLLDRQDLKRGFRDAVACLGGLDILVNNAGMTKRGPAEDFDLSDWDRIIELNLTAVFSLCQLAAKEMFHNGQGKIINIASLLSFFGGYTVTPYAASKGAVAQLTKAMSNEWAGKGIQVNAIAPGYMDTPLNTQIIQDPKRNAEISARIPAGRWGVPNDLIGTIIFLASAASDYISGVVIPVDGGYLGR
jgi:2-deoxy-D-gluconate 3-dehydrogenase